ncbi:MAG: alanine--tRNA ligase, partial [Planctomycetota bacterium]
VPIIRRIEELCGGSFAKAKDRMPYRVVADHIRALVVCISDGVIPSNEGRGYVLRRILRRAVRYLLKLGIQKPALYQLVDPVVETLGDCYKEIAENADYAREVVRTEEENFHRTLQRGLEVFEEAARRAEGSTISGSDAFKLYDTYGFPLDLTRLLAKERGLKVDEAGFQRLLSRQRIRSRTASKFIQQTIALPQLPPTRFVGYQMLRSEAVVLYASDRIVVLDRTPFYAEAGGQVGDKGVLEGANWRFIVEDTRKSGDVVLHYGRFEEGDAEAAGGGRCVANVEEGRRAAIARAHSATHLLHFALRQVVGKHARQAGSLVQPDRLRFDFTHFRPLSEGQIAEVERLVNEKIVEDHPIRVEEKPLDVALKEGVIAIFEEKYRDVVRVVDIGGFSRELCGGTHLERTSQVCLFRIVSEQSVQSGIRRIEAVTGLKAYQVTAEEHALLLSVSEAAGTGAIRSVAQRVRRLREAEKELRRLKERAAAPKIDPKQLLKNASVVGDVTVVACEVPTAGGMLRSLVDRLKVEASEKLAVCLISRQGNRASFVVGMTGDLAGRGFDAAEAARVVGRVLGGSGGGRADFAQGGGPDTTKIPNALAAFKSYLAERIS